MKKLCPVKPATGNPSILDVDLRVFCMVFPLNKRWKFTSIKMLEFCGKLYKQLLSIHIIFVSCFPENSHENNKYNC